MPPSLNRAVDRPHSRGRDWSALRHLPEAILVLVLVRLGLKTLGLARLRSLSLSDTLPAPRREIDPARVARAIRAASRVVPFASCLTQAQAAQIVLARLGIASTLCLGVRGTSMGVMAAHAWLISDGRLMLGGHPREIAGFHRLAELAPTR